MQQKDRKPSQGFGGSDVGELRVGGWFQAGRIKDSEGLMGEMDETQDVGMFWMRARNRWAGSRAQWSRMCAF